jgi:hypothetical protein
VVRLKAMADEGLQKDEFAACWNAVEEGVEAYESYRNIVEEIDILVN